VKALAEAEPMPRPVLGDVVLNTLIYRLGIGDAGGEVGLPCPGTGRTRMVVSAQDVGEGELDEGWVNLVPCRVARVNATVPARTAAPTSAALPAGNVRVWGKSLSP